MRMASNYIHSIMVTLMVYSILAMDSASSAEPVVGRPFKLGYINRCPTGFFRLPSIDQCFKIMDNIARSWKDAKAKCREEGLVMPKPYNAVELRDYLIERFGGGNYWLGARGGAGGQHRWVRDDQPISNSDALWFPGNPGSHTGASDCLWMTAVSLKDQPFAAYTCTFHFTTLCELIMD